MTQSNTSLLRPETAPGIILIISAFAALVLANSPLAQYYFSLLDMPVHIKIGDLDIEKNLLLWVNDGLMALFFLLVGLEVKRELIQGALRSFSRAMFPVVAAIGGWSYPLSCLCYLITTTQTSWQAGLSPLQPTSLSRWVCWHCLAAGHRPT